MLHCPRPVPVASTPSSPSRSNESRSPKATSRTGAHERAAAVVPHMQADERAAGVGIGVRPLPGQVRRKTSPSAPAGQARPLRRARRRRARPRRRGPTAASRRRTASHPSPARFPARRGRTRARGPRRRGHRREAARARRRTSRGRPRAPAGRTAPTPTPPPPGLPRRRRRRCPAAARDPRRHVLLVPVTRARTGNQAPGSSRASITSLLQSRRATSSSRGVPEASEVSIAHSR